MKHYIVVKWKEPPADAAKLENDVRTLFSKAFTLEGIRGLRVSTACVTSDTRYDLMIELDMAREALPAYNASDFHHEWKALYGDRILQKTIFDCE